MTLLKQTSSQTVGPFFAYGLCPEQYSYDLKSLFTPVAANYEAKGEHITIVGNVYDGNGASVGDALIETLQADSDGNYAQSPESVTQTGFSGFARVGTGTDPQQRFIIETVKPGAVGPNHAPYIDVIVLMRGLLVHAFTRIYFDDEAEANSKDEVLASVAEQRRSTLLAKRVNAGSQPVYHFDIYIQGPKETVFFDL